jgi:Ca2+-binding EF-hand superfamily protein
MISEFAGDGKTMIDFQTFATKMNGKKDMWGSAFGDAFDLIDSDKTGKISKEKLKAVMLTLGEKLTDEEAEEMVKVGGGSKQAFITALSGDLGGGGGGGGGRGGGVAGRGGRGGG